MTLQALKAARADELKVKTDRLKVAIELLELDSNGQKSPATEKKLKYLVDKVKKNEMIIDKLEN